MYLTPVETVVMILAIAAGTMITRFIPFLLFPEDKKPPAVINYLGEVLPAAMMGLLVVYCLKDISPLQVPYALPEVLAILGIVFLHKWKGNVLLSIGGGTLFYMCLIQWMR